MSTPIQGRRAGRPEIWLHAFPIPGTVAPTASWAEARGFAGLLLADSQNLVGDPYVELALAARATATLGLGTGNTNPVTRHPAATAAAIATLQAESGGRAVLGIARGDSALAWIGRPAPSVADFARYVARVQGYLRGEPVDLDGFESTMPWIAQAGQPKVPVDVAASGPRVIAAGARLAERVTFTLGADPDRLRDAIGRARAATESAPAGPSLGAYLNVACHPDPAVARELVRGSVGIFAHYLGMTGFPAAELHPGDRPVIEAIGRGYDEARHGLQSASHAALLPDDFLDRFAVVGPPERCVERLSALLALGLDRLVVVPGSRGADPALVRRTNELFAAEVLPALGAG